jgi:DNA-directed RNA polymerase
MEYKNFADTDYDASFITTLPIQADCSNSGLQHYSAMMRDEVGGKATNLIDDEKPNDVYAIVAERVIAKLKLRTDEFAKKWLAYGIDRKICKKPVMCLPYSLTRYSCRMYLAEHVHQQLNERNISHNFGDDLFEATRYLTPIVWESIYETIQGARDIMKFLKTVSSLVSSENLPINWTTPLNFPVQMACYSMQSKRVKTKMGESILMLSYQKETEKIDKRKTSQSICANFIHSLDASVLQLAVVKAHQAGVDNFSVIHDSFGVVAPDTQIMAKAIRNSFCEIYSKDVLKNWADEMFAMLSPKNQRKFPTIPSKGNLNLEEVKNSKFFCI